MGVSRNNNGSQDTEKFGEGPCQGWKSDVVTLSVANTDDQKQFSLEIEFVFLFSVELYIFKIVQNSI